MASSSWMSSPTIPASSSQSWKYDVFLSFRGEDTTKTFVDHLYSELVDRLIHTYKNDKTLPRGNSIGPSLMRAIEESKIAVVIFSKNYGDSSWCLDELKHIMKCRDERGQVVMPIFYDVDPLEVRSQKRKFGEAFDKQKRKNITEAELWRKALIDASKIAGWEPMKIAKIAHWHETEVIIRIVNTILGKLFSLNSYVDKNLVGMRMRSQLLKSQLNIGSRGVRMVGIWGVGGVGKTTLASCVYNEISHHFGGHCFVDNIREESTNTNGLQKLQGKLLSTILKTREGVPSVADGKRKIKSILCHSNVLIVLDDVDQIDQLKALAGSRDWFGDGSRIIITSRDEHLLNTHKVDEVSPVNLLSRDEAIELFHKYAYRENKPVKDYEDLSLRVVSYADGLPLALKVLGKFLYDKEKIEWMNTLGRLRENPQMKIVEKLKISYDGLQPLEKELFLDIACFFRWSRVDETMKILDAYRFHSGIGIRMLIQKALITISSYGTFDMHDVVQEMGHYIVQGEHPHENPEEHSRLWQNEVIDDLCSRDATTKTNDKIRAISYDGSLSCFPELVSNMKKLRFLQVHNKVDNYNYYGRKCSFPEGPNFLSNELRYLHWPHYPGSSFPENFHPTKLAGLRLYRSLQKELWKGYKRLPHLKKLDLDWMDNLLCTPDFDGLPCLEKLSIRNCSSLIEIHQSLGNHKSLVELHVSGCNELKMFPTIVRMETLKTLYLGNCSKLHKFPEIQANKGLPHLKKIELYGLRNILITPDFDKIPCLEELSLITCSNLEEIHPSLGNHKCLVKVTLQRCDNLRIFPTIIRMEKLNTLEINSCPMLHKFPEIHSNMDSLVELNLCSVGIEVFPSSVGEHCTSLMSLKLLSCSNLESIEGNFHDLKCLKVLEINSSTQPKKLPEISLFDEKCCLEKLCSSIKGCFFFGFRYMRHCLKMLDLSNSKLRDGEIPADIGELSNLQELNLSGNDFSLVHFSLSQLTRLKLLNLSRCRKLETLPDLPSNIAILKADDCRSLASVGNGHTNCKRLSVVVLGCDVIGADRLLRSMLQGNIVENHSMALQVHGIEIPKLFTPLASGKRYTLQLQPNWFNDYSGFLMCVTLTYKCYRPLEITMEHGISITSDHKNSFDDRDLTTWVGYLPFASLRHTTWWESISNAISFSVRMSLSGRCATGFVVGVVHKNRGSRLRETTHTDDDDDDVYTHKYGITYDSKSTLKIYMMGDDYV